MLRLAASGLPSKRGPQPASVVMVPMWMHLKIMMLIAGVWPGPVLRVSSHIIISFS